MRKLGILTLLLTLVYIANVQGQTGKGLAFDFEARVTPTSLNGHPEYSSDNMLVAFGYNFNSRLSLKACLDIITGLFDVSPVKTYEFNSSLGANLAYNIFNISSFGTFDAIVAVRNSLGNRSWSFICYEAGIRWGLPVSLPTKMTMNIGIQFMQSHNGNYPDYLSIYAGVGFKFN